MAWFRPSCPNAVTTYPRLMFSRAATRPGPQSTDGRPGEQVLRPQRSAGGGGVELIHLEDPCWVLGSRGKLGTVERRTYDLAS